MQKSHVFFDRLSADARPTKHVPRHDLISYDMRTQQFEKMGFDTVGLVVTDERVGI